MKQITDTILMIRPVNFRMNEQTVVNNYYQKELNNLLPATVQQKAQQEFDNFVIKLKQAGINIIVINDTVKPDTPDSIFPNNWISFHEKGDVAIYSMFAENRRLERREDILDILEEKHFYIKDVIDYTASEKENIFLEGTGSLVLDRKNRLAYCALSPRANEDLVIEFCEDFEFSPVIFKAYQTVNGKREAIYHTNVIMALGEKFAVICLDCIDDKKERKNVVKHLKKSGKEVVAISEDQVNNFAGNMLQVVSDDNKRILIMSEAAFNSLSKKQLETLQKDSKIVYSNVETIEACGGGSVRCMMAEVFLPKV